eukprot:TRINITY_DN22191_c0_g1_i1.p1 TRINITY_DN22191_c0_g1~~TRINITY_DN22191_c0_g1_i1.p1  ORF type:complete len:578 (+),score=80.98 TRINITY_DN22191_c0_g1_i1:68-1801(+)
MTAGSLCNTGEHIATRTNLCCGAAAVNEPVTKKQRMDREACGPPCKECSLHPGVLEGSQRLDSLSCSMECWARHLETAHRTVQSAEEVELPLLQNLARSPIVSEPFEDMSAGRPLAREPSTVTCSKRDERIIVHDCAEIEGEHLEEVCNECGQLHGVFQGTRQFAEFKYCESCWGAYVAAIQEEWEETAAAPAATCEECGKSGAYMMGTEQFTGSCYCIACWLAYQAKDVAAKQDEWEQSAAPPTAACAECGKLVAYMMGTEEFSGSCYCIVCWSAYQAKDKVDACVCASCGCKAALLKGSGEFTGSHYCIDCWCKAVDVLADLPLSEGASDVESWSWKNHYDFIEVGTSDWGTITQYCAGCDADVASLLGEEIRSPLVDLYFARGLAVEPVGAYLDALPSLPNVTKVQCAMGEESGNDVLYGVSSENVRRYQGQYQAALPGGYPEGAKIDVMWYAVSLSSVGHPHPKLEPMLEEIARKDLLESWPVEVLDWRSLCMRHHVDSVDVVQIDCEGRDCSIVRSLLSYCKEHPRAYPRLIKFEANDLTDASEIQSTVDSLIAHGYEIWSRTSENVLVGRG